MPAESMDLDQLQAWVQQINNMVWTIMVAQLAGGTGVTVAAYLAALPTSPVTSSGFDLAQRRGEQFGLGSVK